MNKTIVTTLVAVAIGLAGQANAQFAGAVVDYTPGTLLNSEWDTGQPFNNPNAVLGQPGGMCDPNTWPNVYSLFNPPDDTTALTGIGAGGQLTLQLQNYVNVSPVTVSPVAYGIGVWSNVGLRDVSAGYVGTTGSSAATISPPSSAVVSVSADGFHWITLNSGSAITFGMPGNYYLNAGPYDSSAPATPQLANFGQPFIVSGSAGTLSSLDGKTNDQLLATLNGSAGGTWLSLDGLGLDKVGYIRFSDVPDNEELDLSTVSINSSLAGAPVPAPEPTGTAFLLIGALALVSAKKRGRRE